jgi:protein-S-isoprenylcysteine O-methyltransferase Ste14
MKLSALLVTVLPIPAVIYLAYMGAPSTWQLSQIVGLTLMIGGLLLITIARFQLGNSFSVTPRATALVTHGLYARIRNPIYVFGSFFFAGLILYLDRPWFLLALIPLIAMQIARAHRESKALEARFGDAYREYKARTWF